MLSQWKLPRLWPVSKYTAILLKLGVLFGRQRSWHTFLHLIPMTGHHTIGLRKALIPPGPLNSGQRVLAGRQ